MLIGYVADHEKPIQPEECTLHEMLKPPAYRESVEKLRNIQKIGPLFENVNFNFPIIFLPIYLFTNFNLINQKILHEWRALPKSYPVDQMRYYNSFAREMTERRKKKAKFWL
jgi:hypothetical protein